MFLADTHMHSIASFDSEVPRAEMARMAARCGLSALCFTDHYDIINENSEYVAEFDWETARKEHELAIQAKTGVGLLYGLELGNAFADYQAAERSMQEKGLDFVIGSVHNASKKLYYLDYYNMTYTPEMSREHLDDYFELEQEIACWGHFDTLGHLPYPLRYMRDRDGCDVSLKPYWEQITAILQTIIRKDIALEVNTKRFGQCRGDYEAILKRYRELGGELVTAGADAHRTHEVGAGIAEGYALVKACGFDAITIFQQRKPTFVKL